MAIAKDRQAWKHTSLICVTIFNARANQAKDAKPAPASLFDPYTKGKTKYRGDGRVVLSPIEASESMKRRKGRRNGTQ